MPCPFIGPNNFGTVQIILDRSNSFWTSSNNFEQVQIIKISPEKFSFDMSKMICRRPKEIGPVQNDFGGPNQFWTY